jgi:hypothetical protein
MRRGVLGAAITARYCSNACRQIAYLRRRHPPGEMGPFTMADIDRLLWRPTPREPAYRKTGDR